MSDKNDFKVSNGNRHIKLIFASIGLVGVGGAFLGYHYSTYKSYMNARKCASEIINYTIDKHYDSVRVKDVELIRERLTYKPSELKNRFSVLIGPTGIGKTVAIESADENLTGIIKIGPIEPEVSQDAIVKKVFAKITNRLESEYDEEFMKKVIDLYRNRYKKVPVIIIQASERPFNKAPARLSAAARVLVDDFGLNVLIECHESALPYFSKTGRENMIELEPMSWDMMRQLSEFKELFEMLKNQGNEELVLAICGGAPVLLGELNDLIRINAPRNDEEKRLVVSSFVTKHLGITQIEIQLLIDRWPEMKEIVKMLTGKENAEITYYKFIKTITLNDITELRSVFRQVWRLSSENQLRSVLIPANGAAYILLRMGELDKEPNLDEIKSNILKWSKQKEKDISNEQKGKFYYYNFLLSFIYSIRNKH